MFVRNWRLSSPELLRLVCTGILCFRIMEDEQISPDFDIETPPPTRPYKTSKPIFHQYSALFPLIIPQRRKNAFGVPLKCKWRAA